MKYTYIILIIIVTATLSGCIQGKDDKKVSNYVTESNSAGSNTSTSNMPYEKGGKVPEPVHIDLKKALEASHEYGVNQESLMFTNYDQRGCLLEYHVTFNRPDQKTTKTSASEYIENTVEVFANTTIGNDRDKCDEYQEKIQTRNKKEVPNSSNNIPEDIAIEFQTATFFVSIGHGDARTFEKSNGDYFSPNGNNNIDELKVFEELMFDELKNGIKRYNDGKLLDAPWYERDHTDDADYN